MKYSKRNIGKVLLGTVAGVLSTAAVAGIVVASVPQLREPALDEIAKQSNIYQTVTEENDELKVEISELNTQKEDLSNRINELVEQKEILLSSLTELDNQINVSQDEVTLETLNEKKVEILNSVNELNVEITKLNDDIETLNARIEELEGQKSDYVIDVMPFDALYMARDVECDDVVEFKALSSNTLSGEDFYNLSSGSWVFLDFEGDDLVIIKDASGRFVGSSTVFREGYNFSENFNYSVEIFDASGRAIDVNELEHATNYGFSVKYEKTFDTSNNIENLKILIDLAVTI